MKDNLLISGLLALSILLIPLAVVILLVTSYGMLFGINYFLEHTALINLSPFKIQITHVLLGAVFLSIMFKSNSQSTNAIEKLESSVSYDLNSISHKIDQLSTELNELVDIRQSVESIDSNISDIRIEKVNGDSEYSV
tara:strand:- start:103 stop:516 length:414 start_codon:yes stop_codon:yes gene_type:complete